MFELMSIKKGQYYSWKSEKYFKLCKSASPLYQVHRGIKQRCLNENNKDYKYYGGRGISVCEEWKNYDDFAIWAYENGYERGLTIDRINNDGNYDPLNCRWATRKEQRANQRPYKNGRR
jgi:hypothetical protein